MFVFAYYSYHATQTHNIFPQQEQVQLWYLGFALLGDNNISVFKTIRASNGRITIIIFVASSIVIFL